MSESGVDDVERLLGDVERSSKEYLVAQLLGEDPDPGEFEQLMRMIEEFDDDVKEILDRFGVPESDRLSGLLVVQTLSTLVTVENESD